MAKLSDRLVKEFVRMTNDTTKKKSESFLYGTVDKINEDGTVDVIFDGATDSTPCASSVSVAVGDRVLVMLKNRQAAVTANVSNPSINVDTLRAKNIEFSGTLKGADGSFAGTVTVDWGTENPQMQQIIKLGSDTTNPFVISLADENQDDASMQDAWGFYSAKNGGQTYSQLTADSGLETTKILTTQRNIGIDCGYIQGQQVNSHSYQDFSVTFNTYVYTTAPRVVACLSTSSTAADYGSCSCAVHSITTTGFVVRVYNNASISLAPNITWIAVGGSDY